MPSAWDSFEPQEDLDVDAASQISRHGHGAEYGEGSSAQHSRQNRQPVPPSSIQRGGRAGLSSSVFRRTVVGGPDISSLASSSHSGVIVQPPPTFASAGTRARTFASAAGLQPLPGDRRGAWARKVFTGQYENKLGMSEDERATLQRKLEQLKLRQDAKLREKQQQFRRDKERLVQSMAVQDTNVSCVSEGTEEGSPQLQRVAAVQGLISLDNSALAESMNRAFRDRDDEHEGEDRRTYTYSPENLTDSNAEFGRTLDNALELPVDDDSEGPILHQTLQTDPHSQKAKDSTSSDCLTQNSSPTCTDLLSPVKAFESEDQGQPEVAASRGMQSESAVTTRPATSETSDGVPSPLSLAKGPKQGVSLLQGDSVSEHKAGFNKGMATDNGISLPPVPGAVSQIDDMVALKKEEIKSPNRPVKSVSFVDKDDRLKVLTNKSDQSDSSSQSSSNVKDELKEVPSKRSCLSSFTYNFKARWANARQKVLKFVQAELFERAILTLIVLNTVALALYDPLDTPERNPNSPKRDALEWISQIFSGIFFAEFILKVFGMGFLGGPKTYLADNWNVLDFIIVIISAVDFIPSTSSTLGGLSALRALRPLRAIRVISGLSELRFLVSLLLKCLPMLMNVVLLCLFIFVFFGIVGVQLWKGLLRQRCVHIESGNFLEEDVNCSMDGTGFECPENYNCVVSDSNPNDGGYSFDNIGLAFVTLFQVMTLEGWTNLLYRLQDTYGFGVVYIFVVLVFIGPVLAVNLFLAVIANKFSEAKDAINTISIVTLNTDKAANEKKLATSLDAESVSTDSLALALARKPSQESSDGKKDSQSSSANPVEKKLEDDGQISMNAANRMKMHGSFKKHMSLKSMHAEQLESIPTKWGRSKFWLLTLLSNILPWFVKPPTAAKIIAQEYAKLQRQAKQTDHGVPLSDYALYERPFILIRRGCHWLSLSDGFFNFVMSLIVLNMIFLAVEHDGASKTFNDVLEMSNIVFTVAFFLEMCIKLIGLGVKQYASDPMNIIDAVIVVVSVVDLIGQFAFSSGEIAGGGLSALRAFRLLRIARVVKLLRVAPSLMRQLQVLLATLSSVAMLVILITLFMIIYSILGMNFFGGQLIDPETGLSPRSNFDSFIEACITVFQLLTLEDWQLVFYDSLRSQGYIVSVVYFFSVVIVGNYMLFNLFVAIIIQEFGENRAPETPARSLKRQGSSLSTITTVVSKLKGAWMWFLQKTSRPLSPMQFHSNGCLRVLHSDSHIVQYKDDIATQALQKLGWNLSGASLTAFKPASRIRHLCNTAILQPWFDPAITCLILMSSVTLGMERIDMPDSERKVLSSLNAVFALLFLTEALIKVIANGLFNGSGAYLHSGWNRLDLVVVAASIVDTAFVWIFDSVDLGSLQALLSVLRILRTFRPLRVIARAEGLRVVFQTLGLSIKPILSTVLITAIVFLIFGILGVQLFMGKFHYCTDESVSLKSECFGNYMDGDVQKVRTWANTALNFDHLGNALLTIFVLASQDNWPTLMQTGMDATGTETGPSRNASPAAAIFYLSFMIVGNLLILNIFVGVFADSYSAASVQMRVDKEKNNSQKDEPKTPPSTPRYKPRRRMGVPIISLEASISELEDQPSLDSLQQSLSCDKNLMLQSSELPVSHAAQLSSRMVASSPASHKSRSRISASKDDIPDKVEFNGLLVRAELAEFMDPSVPWGKHLEVSKGKSDEEQAFKPSLSLPASGQNSGVASPSLGPSQPASRNSSVGNSPARSPRHSFVDVARRRAALTFSNSSSIEDRGIVPGGDSGSTLNVQSSMDGSLNSTGLDSLKAARKGSGGISRSGSRVGSRPSSGKLSRRQSSRTGAGLGLQNSGIGVGASIAVVSHVAQWMPKRSFIARLRKFIGPYILSERADLLVAALILLNILSMMFESFNQQSWQTQLLDFSNFFFAICFGLEAALKIFVLHPSSYFMDSWNRFDYVVTLLSFVGIALTESGTDIVQPTILRVFRVFRIIRALRIFRFASGLQSIFQALGKSIPSVGNLFALLFLELFVFAVLGVELFGGMCVEGSEAARCSAIAQADRLSRYAHFSDTAAALETLFRVATNDDWAAVMNSAGEVPDGCTYEDRTCGLPLVAPVFFLLFVSVTTFVLLNLVVAIMMHFLEEARGSMPDMLTRRLRKDTFERMIRRWRQNAQILWKMEMQELQNAEDRFSSSAELNANLLQAQSTSPVTSAVSSTATGTLPMLHTLTEEEEEDGAEVNSSANTFRRASLTHD